MAGNTVSNGIGLIAPNPGGVGATNPRNSPTTGITKNPTMPNANVATGMTLEYETFGSPDDPALLQACSRIFTASEYPAVVSAPHVRGAPPLLGAPELALLKTGSILVNAARAELLDIEALLAGLAENRPAWAFMDVWDDEPPLPGDERLDTPNLILTPHAAWYSPEADDALYERIAEVAGHALRGETARGLIA